ncbi:glycoside hydrolase family 16 protein [Hymenobacter rigui]|uniref:Glycoside hydrolase family 16 protein n=1 Tax=Hymenobacter rigui TaxID=334424 RepID=A0A428KLR3_9BACT|nr:glycoside hydrolase family 16 protein [Hymenobacter rigui]RSK47392.1 glycoside hydrolase family 16 protein [Hymenobacter rigui]
MKKLLALLILLQTVQFTVQAQKPLRYRNWQLVFQDDFDTYRSVADMEARSPWKFTPDNERTLVGNPTEDQYYDSRNVELHDGTLHLIARPLPAPITYPFKTTDGRDTTKLLHYESGWIDLRSDFPTNTALGDTSRWPGNRGFELGLFEIRCKLGGGLGTWPAFWLYAGPTEIDVFEGGDPREASNNIHYSTKSTPYRAKGFRYTYPGPTDLMQGFHTFSVVWTKEAVTYYLDRKWLRTVPASEIPTYPAPVDIIANQAVNNFALPDTWPGGVPGQRQSAFIIDYIKVYKARR